MLNITVLNRLPSVITEEFFNIYNTHFHGKDMRAVSTNLFYTNKVDKDLVNNVNKMLSIPVAGIELYYFDPRRGRGQPHIDRGRKTAFQIPITVDIENSFTFSFKYDDLSMLTPSKMHYTHYKNTSTRTINNPDHWFYEWDNNLYDMYSLEKPILQNAAMPHGGANLSKEPRIIFSCSYREEYEVVKRHFSDWI
jgi:hypothetical protein